MSKKLFISHAASDKGLAKKVKSMLQEGVGINPTQIFFSSGSGTGIPAGQNFVQYMRESMNESTFVLSIITPAYRESEFCLAELGAVWYANDKDFYPLCVPQIDRKELEATLKGIQVERIDEAAILNDLMQRLCVHFEQEFVAAACIGASDEFLASLPRLLTKLASLSVVPAERLEESESANTRLAEKLAKSTDLIDELKDQNRQLREARPSDLDTVPPLGDIADQMNDAIEHAQDACGSLSPSVRSVLPFALDGEGKRWPDAMSYEADNLRTAIDEGFLDGDRGDGHVYLNRHDWPEIDNAMNALEDLQYLLDNLEGPDKKWFRDTFGVPPDLTKTAAFDKLI